MVAQEPEITPEIMSPTCDEVMTINGPTATYLGESLNYSLSSPLDLGMSLPVSYTLNLKNGNKILQKSEESSLQISFGQEGEQLLTATITKGDCSYQVEKSIITYQSSIVYIGGKEDAFQLNYDQNFAEQGKYFAKIFVDTTTTEEDINTLLRKEVRNLSHANIIIIKDVNFDQILHAYIELLEQGLIETTEKELFIISPSNQAFINRVLSLFIQDL
ncbi:MAG: hypothetical protein LBD75_03190 [Candidatus Peribacteria bacterium]|nr:hypothetical protein [Candidatus Peribacteria bacterium]